MFFKRKKESNLNLCAVVDGTTNEMEKVKDPVFAQKMMGDGFAIESTGNTFCACAKGKITAVFPSNHAYGLTLDDGMEVLVHIGIDTVNENGQGFTCTHQMGDEVEAGDVIVEIDRDYLLSKGYDLTTMVIFTNPSTYSSFTCEYGKQVKMGEVCATYKK